MVKAKPFTLIYDPQTRGHLRQIDSKYYPLIHEKIMEQLLHEPETETKNRKPLEPPAAFGARWELRFGPDNRFRVFYSVRSAEREVNILAIGVKEGSRLTFAGREMKL